MIGSRLFYFTIFALVCVSLSERVGGRNTSTSELEGDDLKEAIDYLDEALAKLATRKSLSYRTVKVTKVTVQVVSVTIYTYTVEVDKSGVVKKCTVTMWARPWVGEESHRIVCEGDVASTTW